MSFKPNKLEILIATIDYILPTKRYDASILSWYAAANDLFKVITKILAKEVRLPERIYVYGIFFIICTF